MQINCFYVFFIKKISRDINNELSLHHAFKAVDGNMRPSKVVLDLLLLIAIYSMIIN